MIFATTGLRLALSALLLGCTALRADPALAANTSITFFSTLSEEPLARLEAASIGPRHTRHGPFRMPAPGLEIESPTLSLHDQPCTPDDWARIVEELGRWRRAASCIQFLITLPDGGAFVFQRAPAAASGALSGLVRPLNPEKGQSAEPRLLRIMHDGKDRLRVDLRPLPPVAPAPQPAPARPEPDSSLSSPSAPATASGSIASATP